MRTLTQGPYSVRNKGSWLYFHLGIQLPSLSRRSGPCRSYVARTGVVARGMQPSITWPPVNLGYCLNTDSKCLKWDAIWFQQLHDSYRSYHVMGPTHDNFVKVFNEKRVHQLHVQMRCSLTTRYFILSHWNITHTTTSSNRMISSLYHPYKLKHTQHDFHNLNKWRVLGKPLPQRKPPLGRRVCKCATFRMLSEHYDSCKSLSANRANQSATPNSNSPRGHRPFRFWDEDNYEYEIFSMLRGARA